MRRSSCARVRRIAVRVNQFYFIMMDIYAYRAVVIMIAGVVIATMVLLVVIMAFGIATYHATPSFHKRWVSAVRVPDMMSGFGRLDSVWTYVPVVLAAGIGITYDALRSKQEDTDAVLPPQRLNRSGTLWYDPAAEDQTGSVPVGQSAQPIPTKKLKQLPDWDGPNSYVGDSWLSILNPFGA